MQELETITTKLPAEPPKMPALWKPWGVSLIQGLYGILVTLLASLGATVLLNPSLRAAVLDVLQRTWGGS